MVKIIPFTYCEYFDLYANTYVLVDENDNCVVVDPGKDYSGIVDFIKESELHLKAVLLTHGHFDHIRGVDMLVDTFKVPLYLASEDKEFLTNPHLNCSDRFSRNPVTVKSESIGINDGEELKILSEPIKVIATPFHTPGCVCFYLKDSKTLITGDTLFAEGIGRTDFPLSDPSLIVSSLRKLEKLPDDIKIFPGHNEEGNLKESLMRVL